MELFSYIPFVPEKKTVLRRLGSLKAQFSAELEKDIDTYIKAAQALFSVKGKAMSVPVECTDANGLTVAGHRVDSAQLARLMSNSSEAYLMCASIPEREVNKINEAIQKDEGLKAIVLDAYASEFVDGALDVMISRKNTALNRMGQKLTRHRFSAGYGDLDLKYQKLFYDLLEMQTLGVSLNDRYLLWPEKSVIAIAGVE